MQSLVLFASTLVALINIAYGQGYTEEYYWNGTLSIPVDGRKAIQSGRIYVQMPNSSIPIDIRVHENVNVTLDCGHFIIPSLERRNLNTIWRLRRRNFDGDLESAFFLIPGTLPDGIDIFGDSTRSNGFLRVSNPTLASRTNLSNVGEFTCIFCYDKHSPLAGNSFKGRKCNVYKADINIIGPQPSINRAGMLSSNLIRIGANICIDPQSPALEVRVVCAQIGSINPEPVSSYTFNNQPINNAYFFISQFPSETGSNNMIHVYPGLLMENNMQGSLNCVLQNCFGSDSETTKILYNVTSTFTGLINGKTNTQCPPNFPLNALCPELGQQVNLNCSTNYNNTYNIISPDSSIVANRNLSFIMDATDFGSYTCTSYNDCNKVSNTIILQQCNPPSTICVATGLLANIPCKPCIAERTITSYTWYKNGVFFSNNQNLIDVGPGTYICTASNATGSESQITRVVELNTVALGATPDSVNRCSQLRRPPPAGTDFCAFVGDRVTLRCTPSQAGETTVITPDRETGQKIFNSIQLQDAGSYLCNATTECGPSTNMTNIRVYDPARINRRKILPAPQDNELVQGAGRTSEEVCGRDNNKISLHCCYSGFDQPTTRWLYIAEGSRQAIPVNTSDPNIMITDDDGMNSVLMINPFRERYAGIYRCNTTNIAGTDTGDVNVIYKPPEEKEWLVSTWSRCFANCHHGVRNRTVECVTVSNRMEMDGCTPPPPPSEESCTERGPCTEWVPGNWSVCTKTCGIGYQVRKVSCRATYNNTIELNDSKCLTARPPVFRYCNIHDCPCVEPRFCDFLVGTEMCWRADIQRECCCTCGPAP